MIRSFLVRDLYFVEECLDIEGGQLGHSDWLKGFENTDIVIQCCCHNYYFNY